MKKRTQLGSYWIAEVLVLAFAWACYTSKLSTSETIVGVLAILASVWLTQLVWTLRPLRALVKWDLLIQAWPIPWYLIRGTAQVFEAGLKQIFTRDGASSLIRAVPFVIGNEEKADRTRRILAVTLTTVTPNCIVLGIIPEQKLLLFHQVLRGEVLPMTRRLGAKG